MRSGRGTILPRHFIRKASHFGVKDNLRKKGDGGSRRSPTMTGCVFILYTEIGTYYMELEGAVPELYGKGFPLVRNNQLDTGRAPGGSEQARRGGVSVKKGVSTSERRKKRAIEKIGTLGTITTRCKRTRGHIYAVKLWEPTNEGIRGGGRQALSTHSSGMLSCEKVEEARRLPGEGGWGRQSRTSVSALQRKYLRGVLPGRASHQRKEDEKWSRIKEDFFYYQVSRKECSGDSGDRKKQSH